MVSFAGALCWQGELFLGGRRSVDCEVEEQTQPRKIIIHIVLELTGSRAVLAPFLPTILANPQPYLAWKSVLLKKKKWSKTSWRVCQIFRVYSELSCVLWCFPRACGALFALMRSFHTLGIPVAWGGAG